MNRPDDTPSAPRLSLPTRLLPILGLALSLALSYGAYRLASYSWDQVVSYQSPYTAMSGADFSGVRPSLSEPIPGAEPRRVVLVVIDGLRDDASRTMTSISGLRARGADVRLTVPQPSLSYPTWTTIVSGAPPQISGVTTNWFEGPVTVETLLDVAAESGRTVVVSGMADLDDMFRASERATASSLLEWDEGAYLSGQIVDDALSMDAEVGGADFVFVLMPDMDNAGHESGGASPEYADVASRVDADLSRLIDGLDDGATTFVVLPDHGHIDTGGHGGWEQAVIRTFAAIAGPGVNQVSTEAHLADIAPTVAVLAGMQAPTQGTGTAIDAVLADTNGRARDAEFIRSAGVTLSYIRKVLGDKGVVGLESISSPADLASLRTNADAERLAEERDGRLVVFGGALAGLLALLVLLAVISRRLLVAAVSGAIAYVALYNALFFGLHRLAWSLSAFNEETLVDAFFNQRMLEAALSGLFACVVAAFVYGASKKSGTASGAGRAAGWLGVGTATVLVAQGLLGVQVAWYVWQWSAGVVWILPDFAQAFKYDLDLIQTAALGAAAVAGPLVTWGLGRLFRRSRTADS
jgi:hypothetical protein